MIETDSTTAMGPWIEGMILSYGSQEIRSRVKARILEISKPLHLQKETLGHLVFVSDDVVQIPGILTAEAWKKLQKSEKCKSLMSLSNATVLLYRYSVIFHAEPDEDKSYFFISIEEMISLPSDPVRCNIPKCTVLHAVRQKIRETWRALQGKCLAPVTDTQSGLYMTDLMTEWHKDRMRFLLNVAASCLQAPDCPSSPQPSTSWQTPISVLPHLHLNTGWDVDRVQYKGVYPFVVPTSRLHIPEEQRQSLVTQTGAVEVGDRPSHVTSACGYNPREELAAGRAEDVESSLLGKGLQDEQLGNPWNMFGSASIDTSSLLPAQGSVTLDEVSLNDMPSTPVSCATLPRGMSTQIPFGGSKELFTPSNCISKRKDSISVGPLGTLSRDACSAMEPPSRPLPLSLQESEDYLLSPYQRPRLSSSFSSTGEPCTSASQTVESKDPVRRSFCKASRGQQTQPEKEARSQGRSAEVFGTMSLRPWLLGTPACNKTPRQGLRMQNQRPNQAAPQPDPVNVHPDRSPFCYTYQSTAATVEALKSFSIPDELLQWSVRYLARHKVMKSTS